MKEGMRFALAGGLAYFEAALVHLRKKGLPPDAVYRTSHGVIGADRLRRDKIDVLLCMGYPHILKRDVLSTALCINAHTSLLPLHRGRHPMNWAMILGDKTVGVTIHKMDLGIDTGPVMIQWSVRIQRDDDLNDVHRRLIPLTCKAVEAALRRIQSKTDIYFSQHGIPTYDRKRTPADGRVKFTDTAFKIHRKVNALVDPMPNAFCHDSKGRKVILRRSHFGRRVGEVLATLPLGDVLVAAQDGLVLLQASRNGHEIEVGEILR